MPETVVNAGSVTVGASLSEQAKQHRERPAIEFNGTTWTFGELERQANRMAHFLLAREIGHGARIAILSENCPGYIVAQLAAAKVGAVVACLNWRQAREELEHCIRLVDAKLLITSEGFFDAGNDVASDVGLPIHTLSNAFWKDLAGYTETPPSTQYEVHAEDLWLVLYTSGTTGWPKAAALSHRALLARAAIAALDGGFFPDSPSVVWAPMFHMAGTDNIHISLLLGGCTILMEKYDATALARIATERKLGILPLMPSTVRPFIDAVRATGKPVVSVTRTGSMADLLSPELIAEVTSLVDAPFRNTFGSTETGLAPASKGVFHVGEAPKRFSKVQSSLCLVKLIDPEGQEVVDGQVGEVAVRCPSLFSGYLVGENLDTSTMVDGWYRMGDMMIRTEDGLLDYVDRKKYLIKSGGENIYPAEIERVLLLSNRIMDAVVVREKSEKWGESPAAFIVRADQQLEEADVMQMFIGKLAGYKHPKRIIFVDESELPRNVTGKVQRHLLEKHPALLGTQEPNP